MKGTKQVETQPVAELVDRLGALRAQIATLETEADDIESKIKAAGRGTYAGVLFDATVYTYDREIVGWKAIAYKVGFSRQLKAAHTGFTPVTALTLSARRKMRRVA